MSSGAFYQNGDKMYVMAFKQFEGEIPFKEIKNGMACKENNEYYTITKVKERMVNPLELKLVQNGEVQESPFSFCVDNDENSHEEKYSRFKPKEECNREEPKFDNFGNKLLDLGFYRADKSFFFRGVKVEDYKNRFNRK